MTARHKPNLATSQWVQPLDESMVGASCLQHKNLPWTSDVTPRPATLQHMRDICGQCPVIVKCADRALHGNNGRGTDGGMYAGVWLSWISRNDNATKKLQRRQAQATLERLTR